MELFQASHQWATRPDDERFSSLEAMHRATQDYAAQAAEATVPWRAITVGANGDQVEIGTTRTEKRAALTYYSFGQMAQRVGAPAGFLRQLPAPLAATVLADRLTARSDDMGDNAQLLFHRNGGLVVRALTTENYVRIWNHEVIGRLIELADRFGLVPARPTFRQMGKDDAPSLYASDHDMFAFLMTPERNMTDPVGRDLFKGVIVQNSEVGDCALKVMGFWFRDICGNRIIWGAKEITEVRLTHVGQIRDRWLNASVSIRRYLDDGAGEDAKRWEELRTPLQGTKDEVLDLVFAKRIPGLTRKVLVEAVDAVRPDEDGEPLSRWGLAQGLTRISQRIPFADERTDIDRAAGKLLQVAF